VNGQTSHTWDKIGWNTYIIFLKLKFPPLSFLIICYYQSRQRESYPLKICAKWFGISWYSLSFNLFRTGNVLSSILRQLGRCKQRYWEIKKKKGRIRKLNTPWGGFWCG
jgi:hypothetical protein